MMHGKYRGTTKKTNSSPRRLPEKHLTSIVSLIVSIAVGIVLSSGSALATTFDVNSNTDETDSNPGDGVCATSGGTCTLRAAIVEHNATNGTDTIILPEGGYMLSYALFIYKGVLTISGSNADTTVLDGGGIERVLGISAAQVSISNVTITNGLGNGCGGGIQVGLEASVTLHNCIVSDNIANVGGGLCNVGTLRLDGTTVIGNTSYGDGGGIYNGRNLEIAMSTISNNTAISGGGIANTGSLWATGSAAGTATLSNVTISGNSATDTGGGIKNMGSDSYSLYPTLMATNCTIYENSAPTGGGIYTELGTASLLNTIAANSSSGGNCYGAVSSMGYNLDSGNTCGFTSVGDIMDTDPLLGPLSIDWPGTTETHKLLSGSPAIDAADPINYACTDQRGIIRPQGNAPDIGAYELVPPTPVPTMNEWGMLLFMTLAGFGSITYLKRHRKAEN